MNAEVVNGTITNIKEAALWLSYTFLFVRMGKNPVAYGMSFEEKFEDPQLDKKRLELVREAAETLDRCMMVRFDRRSGNLAVTDLGRVAVRPPSPALVPVRDKRRVVSPRTSRGRAGVGAAR